MPSFGLAHGWKEQSPTWVNIQPSQAAPQPSTNLGGCVFAVTPLMALVFDSDLKALSNPGLRLLRRLWDPK